MREDWETSPPTLQNIQFIFYSVVTIVYHKNDQLTGEYAVSKKLPLVHLQCILPSI
jgi:hypothetical protein